LNGVFKNGHARVPRELVTRPGLALC
jgi:hypothetical protein